MKTYLTNLLNSLRTNMTFLLFLTVVAYIGYQEFFVKPRSAVRLNQAEADMKFAVGALETAKKELIESTHKIDTLAGNLQGIDKSLETYQNVLHDTNELYQQQADVLKQQADEKAAGYSKAKKQVKEAQKKVQ